MSADGGSGCLEDLVEMPLKELALRPVGTAAGYSDGLSGTRIELLAVAELLPKPRTHVQVVTGIDAEVATIEERVHVRPKPLSSRCSPPLVTGRICAACNTGWIFY